MESRKPTTSSGFDIPVEMRDQGVHPTFGYLGPVADLYKVMLQQQLASQDRLFFTWFHGDAWPKRWVLFPRLDAVEQRLKRERLRVRYMRSEVRMWWGSRPEFLGGDGYPEQW